MMSIPLLDEQRTCCVIFDLDGTLIDSAPLVGGILNKMRSEKDLPSLPIASFRQWISLGVSELVARAMEARGHNVQELVQEFRRRYREMPTPANSFFPGAKETLKHLSAWGVRLAICSNKPEQLCRKVLIETNMERFFDIVVGGDTVGKGKPDRAPLDYILKTLGETATSVVLVGDSSVDQRAAQVAGMPFIFFTAGYNDGVDIATINRSIDSLVQLVDIVGYRERYTTLPSHPAG